MNKQPRIAGVLLVLLVTGNTLRIISESMSYLYGGVFYLVMGLSGFIEVCALGWYGVLLWRAMSLPSYGPTSINGRMIERFIPLVPDLGQSPNQAAAPVQGLDSLQ